MPSKKTKVSSIKTVKSAKPNKASKPIAKSARPAAVKNAAKKKPVKAVKASASATSKKTTAKVAAKVVKKPIATKSAAKPISKTKGKPAAKTVGKAKPKKSIAKQSAHKTPTSTKKSETVKPEKAKKPVALIPAKTSSKASSANKQVENDNVRKPTDPFAKKNYADRSVSDVLAISNTIPIKQKNEISASKIASITNSITNPVKKTDSYAVRPEKEPAGKFELEFVIHSSAEMLYEFLSTPSGLSEWFCDDLNIRNGIYTFIWDDQLQQARLLKTVDTQLVRFQWVDKTDGSYFEFRIQRDDLTNDIALIITDFADSVSERESSKLLWHSQIEKLMHVIGSIF